MPGYLISSKRFENEARYPCTFKLRSILSYS